MKNVIKVLTALATIVGAVYVIATYGDKIVAWAKNLLKSCPFQVEVTEDVPAEETAEEAPVEEAAPAEEAPAAEEAPVEEIVIQENEPVADEADFEG